MSSTAPTDAAAVLREVRRRTWDPLQDAPGPAPTRRWTSAPDDVPAARLGRLVAEGRAAGRFVHYVANVEPLPRSRRFRLPRRPGAPAPELEPAAGVRVARLVETDGFHEVELTADDGVPVEFAARPAEGWQVRDGADWVGAVARPGGDRSSYAVREPAVAVPAVRSGTGWVLPAPVLGRVVVTAPGEPAVVAGESAEEAAAAVDDQESVFTVAPRPDGRWESVHELGLRHLVVSGTTASAVEVEAAAHAVERRGAFLCSDETLNEIWVTSAYTLRQCMHELMVDGIKRDRMPWSGDQALSTLSNAFTFADQRIVEDGAAALGRAAGGWINGIVDYSMWWVVNLRLLHRHFEASAFVAAQAGRLEHLLEQLARDADEDGVLHPRPEGATFERPVFIDWTVTLDPGRTSTALQLLWHWALTAGAELLEVAGRAGAARWRDLAGRLEAQLARRAWEPRTGRWTEYLDRSDGGSSHAHLFAALSGIAVDDGRERVAQLSRLARGSTPFIAAFALQALADEGAAAEALERIRMDWGAMLDRGARTFWEEFDASGAEHTAMYGRRFGKSLCHAWATGPSALLPRILCGVRALDDGWRRFEVEPALGGTAWATAVVPVPTGRIFVRVDRERLRVDVPAGCALQRGGRVVEGPVTVLIERGAAGADERLLIDAPARG